MIRRLLAVATLATLSLGPAAARAQTAVSITGGLSAPVSTLGDATDLGYHVGAGLNFGTSNLPVGLRFEGGYDGFGIKGFSGDVRIISGTANAVFNIGTARDAPYLIGGLGAYNRKVTNGEGRTALGVNAGGGLRFPLSGLTTFFEARYHVMLGDDSSGLNYQFIPITFGIMF
ncbi:MAG: outer membrane beta-barrel protein [Gemmatimonadaceae bacterium]